MIMSSTYTIRQVWKIGRYLLCFSSTVLCNLVSDFVLKLGQRLFPQSTKTYEAQKAYRKTKVCLPNQQSIGLFGASYFLCQYNLFFEPPAKKLLEKSEKLQNFFRKLAFTRKHSSCFVSYCHTLVSLFATNGNTYRSFFRMLQL